MFLWAELISARKDLSYFTPLFLFADFGVGLNNKLWFYLLLCFVTSGNKNGYAKLSVGGHTRVPTGIYFGIGAPFKKSCCNISYRFMRLEGSKIKQSRTKLLARGLISSPSGKLNYPALIFWYVCFTSTDSNGGLPHNIVYNITPIDQ